MAFTFDPIFATDPNNPANVAANAAITIFDPNDAGKAPITITDPTGSPIPNPVTVNKNGFGTAFQHATLDRVGWSGGGFEGYFTSYEGMKNEAIAARDAANDAAASAAADAVVRLDELIAAGEFEGPAGPLTNLSIGTVEATPGNPLTDEIIASEITSGTATTAALSATIATATEGKLDTTEAQANYAGRGFLGSAFGFLGDSQTNFGQGYPYYAALLSKGAFFAAQVKSNPGQTSAYILANIDAQIINASPKPTACVILCGANDAQAQLPLATYKANVTAMVDKLRAANIVPVLGTVPPNNNDTYHGFIRTYNAWLMRYAEANKIALVDFYTLLVDPATGDWKTAYDSGDGLHQGTEGNKVMGQLVYDTLKPMLTPRPYLLQAASGSPNIQPNSNFITDTNVDGLADNLSATPSTGFSYSRVDDAAGFKWQRITLDGTAVGQKQILGEGYSAPAFAVGDRIRFAARLRNGQASTAFILQVTCYTAAYGVVLNTIMTAPVVAGMTRQIDGVALAEFTVPAGTEIMMWAMQATGAGTYDIAQPTWYNLTKLGIV